MKRSEFVKAAKEKVGTSGRYLFDKYECQTHWCMMMVYDFMHDVAKIESFPKTFSCSSFKSTRFARERLNHDYKTAEIGDIIPFEINGNRADGPDHVGIVIGNDNGVITMLEGNTKGTTKLYFDSSSVNIFTYSTDASCFDCIIDMSEFFTDEDEEETPENTEEYFTPKPIRILRKGLEGEDVKSLQQVLIAKGYSTGHAMDDGIFGEYTEKSVIEFQKACNKNGGKIETDGIVGPETFNEIWKR